MLELICLTHKVVYIPVGFDNANGWGFEFRCVGSEWARAYFLLIVGMKLSVCRSHTALGSLNISILLTPSLFLPFLFFRLCFLHLTLSLVMAYALCEYSGERFVGHGYNLRVTLSLSLDPSPFLTFPLSRLCGLYRTLSRVMACALCE